FMLVGPPLSAQGTPAGSHIRNWATLAYTSSGFGYVIPSDTVDLVAAQVAGVSLQAPQSSGASPGTAVIFAHTLTNLGNGLDSFSVAATSVPAWPVTLYRDVNSNGVLDGGDIALSGPIAVASGSTAALLVQIAISASGSAGVTDTITIAATSRFDGAVSGSVRDPLSVFTWSGGADTTLSNTVQTTILAPALSLSKQLTSPAVALIGQQVTYRLKYGNAAGAGTAQSVVLTDTLPQGLQYVSATTAPAIAGQVLTWSRGAP